MLFQSMLSGSEEQQEDIHYNVNLATSIVPDNYTHVPTYDGSGQSVHPGLVEAQNGISWMGWRYWLVVAPYPNFNNDFENPNIVVSNDLETWIEPSPGYNPITPEPDDGSHHADNDLFWDYDGSLVCIFHGFTDGTLTGALIYMMRTYDGVNWTPKEIIFENTDSGGTGLSPAIVLEDGGYTLWSENYSAMPRNVYRQKNMNLDKNWSTPEPCIWINEPNRKTLWHIDAFKINNTEYHFILCMSDEITPSAETVNYFGTSRDGITITVGDYPITAGNIETWFRYPYRGSGIWRNGYYDYVFSGKQGAPGWRQGFSTITFTGLVIPNINPPEIKIRPNYNYRFWVNPTYRDRVNFNSSEPFLEGSNSNGFLISGKTIIDTIIHPLGTYEHYFLVDSIFVSGDIPTIKYTGVEDGNESDIKDGKFGGLSDFVAENITLNF